MTMIIPPFSDTATQTKRKRSPRPLRPMAEKRKFFGSLHGPVLRQLPDHLGLYHSLITNHDSRVAVRRGYDPSFDTPRTVFKAWIVGKHDGGEFAMFLRAHGGKLIFW